MLTILDPRGHVDAETVSMAPRPKSLDGLVLGVFSNRKTNADRLLAMVEQRLAQRFRFKDVVWSGKDKNSLPAPPGSLDPILGRCDVAITAIGD
jgi:hypothetical protein